MKKYFMPTEVFNNRHNYRKSAFTLAEVLITLGIIGVVAALTMPSLIAKNQEKVTVTRLKKEYSTISQAYTMVLMNDGKFSDWFTGTETTAEAGEIFYEKMKKHLNVAKDCNTGTGCFSEGIIKTLDGRDYNNYNNNTNEPKIILADGSSWMFYVSNINCVDNNYCGNIKVDIDGPKKGSYTFGKDVFLFYITPQRIFPEGDSADPFNKFEINCNKSKTSSANGIACTDWVLQNENMNYLACDDLSWGGKTKCN